MERTTLWGKGTVPRAVGGCPQARRWHAASMLCMRRLLCGAHRGGENARGTPLEQDHRPLLGATNATCLKASGARYAIVRRTSTPGRARKELLEEGVPPEHGSVLASTPKHRQHALRPCVLPARMPRRLHRLRALVTRRRAGSPRLWRPGPRSLPWCGDWSPSVPPGRAPQRRRGR